MRLLLASNNQKKRLELERILGASAGVSVELVTPDELGGIADVVEDGDTFADNAEKKALAAAEATGLWALGDDSGLVVDALGGAPGVYSARYAGEPSDDANNNAKLLRELADVPEAERGAQFVCALVLASPGPDARCMAECTGAVRGRILTEARGDSGFGYDPLFLFTEEAPGHGKTFAELGPDEKSSVSHRGRALAQLATRLAELSRAD